MVSTTVIFVGLCCLFAHTAAIPDVRLPPSITDTDTPSDIIYKSDSRIVLTCQATGFPTPSYEWYRNGVALDLNTRNLYQSDGDLTIDPMTSLDEGHYQCRASNNYGTSVSNFFLQRAFLARPLPSDPTSYTQEEGKSVVLNAQQLRSVPAPTYSWGLMDKEDGNERPLPLSPRVVQDDNGNLYFSFLLKEDNLDGNFVYKLNTFNSLLDLSVGGSYSSITVTEGNLTEEAPTALHVTPSPYIAVKGGVIRLQCIFAGLPEVSVTWSPLPADRSRTEMYGTILVIEPVEPSDKGTYNCVGHSRAGELTKSIEVDVHSKPEFEDRPVDMNATEGESVSINCGVLPETKPDAHLQWFINGEEIHDNYIGPRTQISGDRRQLMTFTNLCKDCPGGNSDLRVVQCKASNRHGYAFADVYLNVLLRTVILKAPEDQHLDEDAIHAVFHCEASSDPSTPVTVSWEYPSRAINITEDPRLTVDETSLRIDLGGMLPEDKKMFKGVYTCVGTNGYSTDKKSAQLTIGEPPPSTSVAVSSFYSFVHNCLHLSMFISYIVVRYT